MKPANDQPVKASSIRPRICGAPKKIKSQTIFGAGVDVTYVRGQNAAILPGDPAQAQLLAPWGYFSTSRPSASAHSRNVFAEKRCSSDVAAAAIDRNTPARMKGRRT
jgi:hypothetical protein